MKNQIVKEDLKALAKDIQDVTKLLKNAYPCPELRQEWISRAEVMSYLGFGATQMNAIEKKYNLQKSKIGKRIFYNTKQLLNIINSQQEFIN